MLQLVEMESALLCRSASLVRWVLGLLWVAQDAACPGCSEGDHWSHRQPVPKSPIRQCSACRCYVGALVAALFFVVHPLFVVVGYVPTLLVAATCVYIGVDLLWDHLVRLGLGLGLGSGLGT